MITREQAEHFAREWIDAWNSHDLGRILSHYSEDFSMSSPRIVQIADEPSGTLQGRDAVGAYWGKALKLLPNLHFELQDILVGTDSVTLYYHGTSGMAAEVFFFNERHLVCRAYAHYA
ncbi:hypothetical protein A167_01887 [Alcanivorax sp. S71-1-4]|jgi:ketosteroid isomerase-like protein|uniref:nuclear transport factor 2 family protein n=1 Tax=Alcanivorax sp. S71-1-4 TaxID=1177159 RepID=UPI00135A25E2|nr:nuclear transport factor 2 family protein [Alcanivorax sp. S71-1-4]KAF0809295.1 hypothetical protein A167_01887 [Alcanivorax sp. S71-1-4]